MNRSQTRRVASGVAIIATLALGFAACGGDDDDTDSTTTPTESEATTPGTTDVTETTDDTDVTDVTDDTDESAPTGTGDSDTYEADAYIEAVVEEIGLDDTETATCVAEAVVDAIGVERIEASGVAPEDFASAPSLGEVDLAIEEANASSMQDDLEACGDLVEMFVGGDELSDLQQECADEHLTTPLVAELFVAQFIGIAPSDEATAATEALQECAAEE